MAQTKPIEESLKEYSRGITGGILFSLPMLYTMEVWWEGFIASPFSLLLYMAVTFIVLLGYNRFAGLHPNSSWKEIIIDSVEEMGIGLILAFAFLLMLNRIQGNMPIDEIAGKIIVEAMLVSIGVSIGTAQLGMGNGGKKKEKNEKEGDKEGEVKRNQKMSIVVLAACGSLIVGGNVAPTEEVPLLAFGATPLHILIMSIVSILLCIVVVFFSDFKGTGKERPKNFIYHILFDTSVCYVVALGVSAFVLWFFGRFDGMGFWPCFSQVIVLGVLSSFGASAGRLLIK